jgi:general secretion pathway protein D
MMVLARVSWMAVGGGLGRSATLVVLLLLLLLGLAGCAQQRIRDASQEQLAAGQYETAVSQLEQGLKAYPESTVLRAALIQARSDALSKLIADAASARTAGQMDEAEKALRRAAVFDTSGRVASLLDQLALQRKQRKLLDDAQALMAKKDNGAAQQLVAEALRSNPRDNDLLALQRRLSAEARDRQMAATQAGLSESRPISLDFRDASLRNVLDAVSRHSGLNFIFDKDVRADINVTVFLRAAKVADALDLITSTNQLAIKVLDERTILVYPNTPEKQREHQEQVVKVFYLASSDAKAAAAFLKSMLRLREPYVDERLNLVALRDSQENIALAERLLAVYDGQEAEVLLEVEVLEVRTSRLTDLGIKFPDTFSLTPFPPGASAALTLANIDSLSRQDIRVGVGGITVSLRRELGDFTTLANPRIRARSREKAKIMIGDKVPVVTTTTGQGGFVGESVNYLDVGLKLDVEPTVYPDDEVSIRVALEVSTVAREIRTSSGSLAYQIGTRNASTMLRLRDGQTQLLAGLISRDDRTRSSRVPGLGDLPLLGRLFSSQSDDTQRTELVLAITPRIVRNVRLLEASESEIWVGTEAQPRLRPYAARVASNDSPAVVQPAPSVLAPTLPNSQAALLARTDAPAAQDQPLITTQWRGPPQVSLGDVFVVTLDLDTATPLRGGPVRLAYDKDRFTLMDVLPGDLMQQGGATAVFSKTVDAAQGTVSVGVLRNEATGAAGKGLLLQLRLKAKSVGDAEFRLLGFEPVTFGGVTARQQLADPFRVQVAP